MSSFNPLLGTFDSLDDLFPAFSVIAASATSKRYKFHPDEYPLRGLPGCVDLKQNAIQTVWPSDHVVAACQERCLNGVIDHFRCIRSAALMAHGLLPVYCADGYGASFLVAFVPYSEYTRFAGEGDR